MRQKIRDLLKYLLPFCCAVLIFALITNFNETMEMFSSITKWLSFLISRFLIGLGIAYTADLPARWMERKFRFPRWASVTSVFVLSFGLITWMIIYIIPMIGDSITQIVSKAGMFYTQLQQVLNDITLGLEPEMVEYVSQTISGVTDGIFDMISSLLNYSNVSGVVTSTGRTLFDIGFGVIVAIYVLIEKNSLIRHIRQFIYAVMKTEKADAAVVFVRRAHKIFSRYIAGNVIDSLFVMTSSMILYSVFGLPSALFMALIAAVTNLIPYFGPIIGGVVTCVIMLCFDPMYVVIALAIIIALQTVDGMIIAPKILGDSVGISPLLTIVAVTIGGDIGGFLGMFLGVPVIAIIKILVYDPYIAEKIKQRKRVRDAAGEGREIGAGDVPLDIKTLEGAPPPPKVKRRRSKTKNQP